MTRETKAIFSGAAFSLAAGLTVLAAAEQPHRPTVDECAPLGSSCEQLRACGVGPEVECERITEAEARARGLE